MLRSLAVALGVICFGGGWIALLADAWPGALIPLVLGALLLLGTLWERVRYKPLEVVKPGAGFVPTEEWFVATRRASSFASITARRRGRAATSKNVRHVADGAGRAKAADAIAVGSTARPALPGAGSPPIGFRA
jgi:hypothetical protein